MLPMPTAPIPGEPHLPNLTKRSYDFITARLARRDPPERIAAALRALFEIEIEADQVVDCWRAHKQRAAQTGPGQETESTQIPHEPAKEVTVQRLAQAAPPEPVAAVPAPVQIGIARVPPVAGPAPTRLPAERDPRLSPVEREPAPEDGSEVVMPDDVRAHIIQRMARRDPIWWIAQDVAAKFGFVVDRDEIIVCWRDRDVLPTQTGPRQEKESMPKLNDEIKEFIVKRIACYETPSRIAAAVKVNFGVDIDRRQVFEYDPAGSRPPAQRWIDLHSATRAQFLRDIAEIGVAQKAIRLRMLDRFAQMAEDDNRHDKAAKFLEQAARECGGFYERQPRTGAPAARGAAGEPEPSL